MVIQKLELPKRKVKLPSGKLSEMPDQSTLRPLDPNCTHHFLLPPPKGDWIIGYCEECDGQAVHAAHFASAQAISNIEVTDNRLDAETAEHILTSLEPDRVSDRERERFKRDFIKGVLDRAEREGKKSGSSKKPRNSASKPKRKYVIVKPKAGGRFAIPTLKKIG